MKGKVIVPLFSFMFGSIRGMALWPFILIMDDRLLRNQTLINHEQIHIRQQTEMLVIPFYLVYLTNYLVNRFKYKTHDEAYRNIVFEREAYDNDQDLHYLDRRKFWSWTKYI